VFIVTEYNYDENIVGAYHTLDDAKDIIQSNLPSLTWEWLVDPIKPKRTYALTNKVILFVIDEENSWPVD